MSLSSFTQYAPLDLYSPSDWAELFALCAKAVETEDNTQVQKWLEEYSNTQGFLEPTQWDVNHIINESLCFMGKFAENWHDNLNNATKAAACNNTQAVV